MKEILLSLILLLPLQAKEAVEGEWSKDDGSARIKLWIDQKSELQGVITWVQDKTRTHDTNNPEPKLRKRRLRGLKFLSGFKKDGDQFTGGKVYDSKSGNTYSGKIWTTGDDKLTMRAFKGISLLGKSAEWTRHLKK